MTSPDLFARPEPVRRGTRLPSDWKPTLEAAKFARDLGLARVRCSARKNCGPDQWPALTPRSRHSVYRRQRRGATPNPPSVSIHAAAVHSYTTGKRNKSSASLLSSVSCSYSVPAGVRCRIGYIPLVGGRVSAMPRASLSLVSTSHTLLGVASRKRALGLSA